MADEPILASGAVALVTGASAGFGVAITEALVAKGCRVIAAARRLDRLRALGERLGPNCHPLTLDVTDAAATGNLIERLPEELRAIDILVNNAGHDIGGRRRFDKGDMAQWASIVETNVTGLMRVTRAVAPGMVERDRGHIVNLGSISGFKAYAGGTIYAASKFAVHGFTASLRADYVGTGIRVTEILAGHRTDRVRRDPLAGRQGEGQRLLRRLRDAARRRRHRALRPSSPSSSRPTS